MTDFKKAIILDGSKAYDNTSERIRTVLLTELQNNGWDVEYIVLRKKIIGNCAGDYFCWIRTPGICQMDDDNRKIARGMVTSDLMVYLTPVTFGGYSSMLKRMVDHQIQNISPFFTKVEGETHHKKRYKKYPAFLAVGWMDTPDERAEELFRYLAQRNGINFYAENTVSGVILSGQSDGEIQSSVHDWMNDLHSGLPSLKPKLPVSGETSRGMADIQRALLLVGSPKTRMSTSNALGEYLYEQLAAQSIQTKTVYLHAVVRSPEKMKALLDDIDTTDLITLAFPLYIDSLPAPVIETLEIIAEHRQSLVQNQRQLFAAIANCGFPEAQQNAAALAICETFTRQARFDWAGSLALGGGGMVHSRPLGEQGDRILRIKKSLELAAEALVQGLPIPKVAQDLLAKPIVPNWLYRLFGDFGWNLQARSYGTWKSLKHQPYVRNLPLNN
ncbi:NAD(P)H-dependent oxidoreductase [Chloroflexota bacterium]